MKARTKKPSPEGAEEKEVAGAMLKSTRRAFVHTLLRRNHPIVEKKKRCSRDDRETSLMASEKRNEQKRKAAERKKIMNEKERSNKGKVELVGSLKGVRAARSTRRRFRRERGEKKKEKEPTTLRGKKGSIFPVRRLKGKPKNAGNQEGKNHESLVKGGGRRQRETI